MDYWKECIEIAFEDAGITATKEQIELVAGAVEGGHENYGMAFGHDCIPNPLLHENKQLEKQLEKERNAEHCKTCNGVGRVTTYFGVRSSNSDCHKCNGKGKIYQ